MNFICLAMKFKDCDHANFASAWEEFTVVDKGNGFFNFKSHHGKFLVAEPNGNLKANRVNADIWETFKVEKAGGKCNYFFQAY